MKVLLLLLALWLGATSAQFAPNPLNTLTYLSAPVNFTWTPCYSLLASSTGIAVSDLSARCGDGGLLFVSGIQSSVSIDFISFGTNYTSFFNNATVGSVRFFSTSTTFGFTNESTIPVSCAAISPTSSATFCRNVQNGVFRPGMFLPSIGYSIATNVATLFFYSPSYNKSVGDNCSTPLGLCSLNNTIQANGTCSGGSLIPEPAYDPCIISQVCNPVNGTFVPTYRAVGAPCNGTDPCGVSFACNISLQCAMTQEKECISTDLCKNQIGTCNPLLNGTCEFTNAPDGTTCTDNNLCTTEDKCSYGVCNDTILSTPPNVTCGVPSYCVPENGSWIYIDEVSGVPCEPENVCQSTAILGANFQCFAGKLCLPMTTTNCSMIPPLGPCYGTPTCSNVNRNCSDNPLNTGDPCDDSDPCTSGTQCRPDRSCGNGSPVTCPSSGLDCQIYAPTATSPTQCDCVLRNVSNSANRSCSLPNSLCLQNLRCFDGDCIGDPRLCPGDSCNGPTTCSLVTGCKNPINENLPCNRTCYIDSICVDGTCALGDLTPEVVGCAFAGASGLSSSWCFVEQMAWVAFMAAIRFYDASFQMVVGILASVVRTIADPDAIRILSAMVVAGAGMAIRRRIA